MEQITPRQLKNWLDDSNRIQPVLVDIRDTLEFEFVHIEGSLSIPFDSLPENIALLESQRAIVLICYGYERSVEAALFLKRRLFQEVFVLLGGIHAWLMRIDTHLQRY